MNRSTSTPNIRIFISCLLTFLILMAPIASVAAATRRNQPASSRKTIKTEKAPAPVTQNAPAPQPLSPLAFTVTASLTDDILLTAKKNPGDTINYTATITNTGTVSPGDDATGVAFNDILDNNTSFVPGSLNASPLAFNDSFSTIGNTLLEVGVAASGNPAVITTGSVLTNDVEFLGDTFTLKAPFPTASTNGGTVTMNSSGNFSYLPPVGFTGNDTFTYTITDDGTNAVAGDADDLTGTGTVTIAVNGPLVWYVNNSAGAGDGRSSSPFNSLTPVNGAGGAGDADAAGSIIYIFTGGGNYTTGIQLEANQLLTGNGVALVVNTITLRAAGARPTITNTAVGGIGVQLASSGNNILAGFNVGDTGLFDIANTTTTTVGTLNISNVGLSGTGGLFRADSGGALTVNFDSAITTSATGNGIQLTGTAANALSGTFTAGVAGNGISGVAGVDVLINGSASSNTATVTINSTISSTAGGAIEISGRSGANPISFPADINVTGGFGISVHDNTGTGTITFSDAGKVLSTGTNAALSLVNNPGLIINVTGGGLDIDTTTGAGVVATGGGTVTIQGATNTIDTGGATALNVANTFIGLAGLTFQRISSNGGGAGSTGIILNTVGTTAGTHGALTVTGTGTDPGSGGIIQNKDQGAVITSTINLSLKNMNFTTFNGNGTCNNVDNSTFNDTCQGAINLSSVTGVTLDRLVMSGGAQIGINGRTVTNMVLSNSSLTGFGNAVNENDLRFFNLTGTVSITGSTLANPGEFIVDIRNNTGTLNMTVDGVTFNDTDTSAFGAAGFSISSLSASTINLLVDNSVFTRIVNAAFQASAKNTSTLNVDFTDNSVEQLTATTGRAFEVVSQNTATAKFNVNHNLKLYSKGGTAVNLVGFGSSTLMGRVNNNPDIRCGGVGSPGTGISFSPEDNTVGTVEIIGNTISQIGSVTDAGIRILPFGDNISQFSATADATIQSNSIAIINNGVSGAGYNGGLFGIQVNAGSNASDLVKTCAAVGGTVAGQGNAVTAAPLAINNTDNVAFRVRVGSAGSNLYLQGFSGSPTATWNSRNNTPVNSVNVSLAAGAPAPSAPPAGAPYFGVCRTPTNPTALNISPFSPSRDDYAKANSVQPNNNQQSAFASIASGISASNDAESAQANPSAKRMSHHPTFRRAVAGAKAMNNSSMAMAPLAGETVTVNVGTLPAGKVLTIKYAALISTTPTASSVTTQGTVTGTNFAAVSTDDPEPAGANDPTVTNINLPDLTILKSHTGNFRQGDTGKTYTITVSNVGTFATFAGNTVTVTDNLPAGLTVTALSGTGWTCTTIPVGGIAGPTTLTCTRTDSLAAPPPASSYPDITLTVDVAANANPSITNTASVSGGGDTTAGNNSSSDSTTVVQVPDLTIDKAHIGSFFQGQTGAQYTVTVGNAGPGPVLAGETITVTDTLPTGLTPTLASGTNWSCNIVAQLVTCTRTGANTALAMLGSYPVITVTVDVAANANVGNPGVTNSATVAAGAGVELNTANNTDNDPTQIVAGPDLSIDKSHIGDFTQGETGKTYTIAVSNVGGTATSGTVTVTENLPAGLTATGLSGTGWTCTVIPVGGTPGPAVLTCTRPDSLPAAGSYPNITLTVDVSLTAPASVNNNATVANAGDVNAANDSDTDPTTIIALCLTPPADMAAWWTGDETGADPPRDIAGGNDGTLNGNATYAAGKVLNGFTLDGTGDYVEAPDSNSLDITTAITIDAWVNPTNANANGRIVDKITPGNTDGYLLDLVNGNLRFISGSIDVQTAAVIPQGVFTHVAVTYDGVNVVLYINGVAANTTPATGAIPVNALPLRIGADQAGNFGFAGLIDEVEIFSRALAANEINDIFTANTGGKCKPADLTITKTHTDPFVQGSTGNTYTITVHNDGPGATTGTVTVVDTVPAGLTPTAPNGAHNGWNCSIVAQTVTCDRSDVLASGADYPTITLTVTAGANTASVINNVTVSGGGELDASDSFANDTTNLTPSSDLLSVKIDSPDPVTAGTNISYDITVTNNGPSDAQSVTLTDAVPANTTFVSAVHNTGPVFSCVNPSVGGTGNVVCSIATMPTGTSSTFTMVVNVNAATAEGTTITNNAVAATTTNDPFPLNNTGTATTSVIQSDIEITSKTDTPDPVEAGSNITYTVNFKNNSAVNTASNVTVTDAVPAGTTFVSAAAPAGWSPVTPAVGGTGNIVFSKALVAGAETAAFTIVVKVDNSVTSGTIITNTATAATTSLDTVSANNSASTTTTVVVNADLAVTSKTDTPDPVLASQNITYAINFQNNGPSDAQGVTITDAVPTGTTFVSASVTTGSGWTIPSPPAVGGTGNVVFSKTTVAVAETAVFEVVVKVNNNAVEGSTITNSATAAGTTNDPTPGNNTAGATTTVNQSDIEITSKTDTPDPVEAGSNITYTVNFKNNSAVNTASNVTVTDAVPTGTTLVSATTVSPGWARTDVVPVGGTGNIVFSKALVAASETAVFTIVVKVNTSVTSGTIVTNTTTAATTSVDTVGANNSASATTTVEVNADLAVTSKTDTPDPVIASQNITYAINFQNNGPSDAQGVTITDAVPTGTTFISASVTTGSGWAVADPGVGNTGNVVFSKTTVAVAETAVFEVVVKVNNTAVEGSIITNNATAAGTTNDPTAGNNTGTATTTVNQSDIEITSKTDTPDPVNAGENITYTVNFKNNSAASTASNVTVTDAVPAGTTLVSATTANAGWARTDLVPPGGTGSIVFSKGLVLVSETAVFTIVVKVDANVLTGTTITNTATAATTSIDTNSANNSASATTTTSASADLAVTKTDTPDPVTAGDNITYTISFVNNGPSDAQTVTVTDAVPANTTFVSATPHAGWSRTDAVPVGGTGSIVFSKATVAAGETASFTVVVKVNSNTPAATTITNDAVAASATTDPTPGNNTGTATTTVVTSADLLVVKVESEDPVAAGANLTYTITVTNGGSSDAQSLSLSDTLPAFTTLVSFTVPAGWTRTDAVPNGGTGTVSAVTPTLVSGASAVFTLVVNVNIATPHGTILTNTATAATTTTDPNPLNNSSTETTTVIALPDAIDDHYFGLKDQVFNIPAPGVLSNDTGPSLVVTPVVGGATSAGGTYTINANGSFTYTPPAGFSGTDGFNYTITNPAGSDSAHVELTVTDPATIALRISEFRFNGPNGATDEFFEIYNASPTDHQVGGTSLSNSGGYGLFASAGNGVTSNTVTLVCLIPNGTIIPARGYVLCTGSNYSLATLGAAGSSTGSAVTPAISGVVPTAVGNFPIINGTVANPGAYTSADVPNDSGLVLANVGTNTVGASSDVGNGTFGFNATGVAAGNFTVWDRVGFAPYGAGAPLQTCQLVNPAGCGVSGSARPSLADNYCEGGAAGCLRPVGDASTTNHGTSVFYGDSGQYSLLRRQTTDQSATIGTVPQDTANNSDDFVMVSPTPGINIAFTITNFPTGATAGLVSVLGAAGPQNNAAPADLAETRLQSSLFDSSRTSAQLPNAERRYVLDNTTTTINNNPMGSFIFRFGFRNTSAASDINRLRFRIDNLSVPCGEPTPAAGTGTVGSGNARNLVQTSPNCQGTEGKTAILKMLNMPTEFVAPEVGPAVTVRGSVIEDTDGTKLAPNGGGINNSLVRTGTAPGSLTGEFTTVVPAGGPGPKFFIAFRMGVVKGGSFRFLFMPEGSSTTPLPAPTVP